MYKIIVMILSMGWLYGAEMVLESPDVGSTLTRTQEYNALGCHGENISPTLTWRTPPKGTRSFALVMYDTDAKWWHWLVLDIPSAMHALPRNFGDSTQRRIDRIVQSRNDFGKSGFGGACPPIGSGVHHYVFTLYALNVPSLGVSEYIAPTQAYGLILAHTLGKASWVATYRR